MASIKIFVVLAVGIANIHAQAPATNVDPAAKTVATGGTDFVVTSGQPAAPSPTGTGQQAGSLLDMALQSFGTNTPTTGVEAGGSQPPATGSNSLNTASSFMDAVNNLLTSPTGNMDPKILANLGLPTGAATASTDSQLNSIPNQVGTSGPSTILDPNMQPLGGNNGIPNGALVNMPLSSSSGSGVIDPLAANQGQIPNPTAGPTSLPVDPGMTNFVDPSLSLLGPGPSRGDTAGVAAGTDPATIINTLNQPTGAGPLGSISGANPGPTPDPLTSGPLGTGPPGSDPSSGLSGGAGGPGGLLGPIPSAGGQVLGLPTGAAGPLSALGGPGGPGGLPGGPGGITGKVRQIMTVPGRGPLAALSHAKSMAGVNRNQGNNNNNLMTTLLMSMMMGGGEITPTMMMMLMSASGGGNMNAMLPALLMMGQ